MKDIISYHIFSSGNYTLTVLQVLFALCILIATKIFLLIVKKVIDRRIKANAIDSGRYNSLYLVLSYFVWIVAILAAMQAVGIKLNVILAGGAALLVGIGLGLQSLFHDFVSGIIILLEGTIELGDVIEVEGIIGRVSKITLRNSQIKTMDNNAIIVPNHFFISEKVINWSHEKDVVRFSIDVGVAYGSDTAKVVTILEDAPKGLKDVSDKKPTFARFNAFGESSLDFKLFFWTDKPFTIEPLKSKIRLKIDQRFREENITIPFPQRDLHMKS